MDDRNAVREVTPSLSTCFCSRISITRSFRQNWLILFLGKNGIFQGCFQSPGSSGSARPGHRRFSINNKSDVRSMQRDIEDADQIVLIIPDTFSEILDFTLDLEMQQTSSLPRDFLTRFSRLSVWSCIKHVGPTGLAKVAFYSAGIFVTLIELSRVFPLEAIFPQAVRENFNTPIRTRNRSSAQPLRLSEYEMASDSRPSTR